MAPPPEVVSRPSATPSLQVAVGLVSVLAGLGMLAVGTAGVVETTSTRTDAFVGGLAALGGLFAIAVVVPEGESQRTVSFAGLVLGLASAFSYWALVPADAGLLSSPMALFPMTGYGIGFVTLLASVLMSVTQPAWTSDDSSLGEVKWVRSDELDTGPTTAADGGSGDDDRSVAREEGT